MLDPSLPFPVILVSKSSRDSIGHDNLLFGITGLLVVTVGPIVSLQKIRCPIPAQGVWTCQWKISSVQLLFYI